MADVNGQRVDSPDRETVKLDRRRRGRVAYQNEHLIAILRGTAVEDLPEPVFEPVAQHSWLWLVLGSAAVWAVLICSVHLVSLNGH
jgi:hypothetical protein